MVNKSRQQWRDFLFSLTLIWIIFILFFAILIALLLYQANNVPVPKIGSEKVFTIQTQQDGNRTTCGKSFAQENKFGIYEIYAEGAAFERGYTMGRVMQDLKLQHETNFVDSINTLVPSPKYLQFLKIIVGILNRNLYKYFQPEFLEELYGLSFSSSEKFNYIAKPYQRILNYHAAHDIGHALQNFGLVGCSSFVTRNERTENHSLLLARNLDFSPSESFNELKALYFINPENGNKYVSYSWPGFIGVVSGMNQHGLCVVVHAAKSKMRFSIGTPVSIVAREIMQYANDLNSAREILKKRKTFVSELFLVVSAKDNSAIVFEKEPESLTEYEMHGTELICTNHLLSEARKNEAENLDWKETISSAYREKRLKELLEKRDSISPQNAIEILRDVHGLNDENIGLQNENAINQLAAHHGIIFNATTREFWVSANPYILGEMVAYNFDKAFLNAQQQTISTLHDEDKTLAKSVWFTSEEYQSFLRYKNLKKELVVATKKQIQLSQNELKEFETSNPLLFHTHEILGDYFVSQQEREKAKQFYEKALSLNIPTKFEKNRIEKKWRKL